MNQDKCEGGISRSEAFVREPKAPVLQERNSDMSVLSADQNTAAPQDRIEEVDSPSEPPPAYEEKGPDTSRDNRVSEPPERVADDGPSVTALHLLGSRSQWVSCPFCKRKSETKVKKSDSGTTMYVVRVYFVPLFSTSND